MLSLDKTDRVIINLKVLATLKEGERVCMRNGQFSLYNAGWGQSITRWFYQENRWVNFEDVQNVFNEAICILGTYMNMAVTEAGKQAPHAALTAVDTISKELVHAMAGLAQLRKTYEADPLMVATLDVLIERTHTEVEKAHGLLGVHKYSKAPQHVPAAPPAPLPAALPTALPAHPPPPPPPPATPPSPLVAPQVITVQPKSREVVAKQ